MMMPFGKFRGVELEDIPERYLHWCNSLILDPDLAEAIKEELFGRSLQRLIALYENNRPRGIQDLLIDFIHRAESEGCKHHLLEQLKAIAQTDETNGQVQRQQV